MVEGLQRRRQRASSVDATCRYPGGTSTDTSGPRGYFRCWLVRPRSSFHNAEDRETPDTVGLITAQEYEEGGVPPQEKRKTDEPTATWEDENSALTLQPNSGPGDQEAAER
ncbi:hypothetical protein NDU88_001913 [Pleurodeles waltl]|uniref:Uncharacterized protein n=1 Tax=Pleurodeles waltl TaxID=8319 RepID=A0AAV7MLU0_PLEWA|nr:hypothetical protein NDU88_001913 [Pleurodeles waltl]